MSQSRPSKSNTMLEWRERLRRFRVKEPAQKVSSRPNDDNTSSKSTFDIETAKKPPLEMHSSQAPPPTNAPAKSYGLFQLSKEQPGVSEDLIGVDIVAIHGLNGDAYTTWQHENGTLWLRDLLPNSLPGSRVFTYGYPSELFFSNSTATLRDYSRSLLKSLTAISEQTQRPLIFVCHSLGGIVCKQALVLAHEDNHIYGDILSATSAIVFFGTPHRGSKEADIGKVVTRVVNMFLRASQTARIVGPIRDDLLTTLGSNSQALTDLAISSRNRLKDLEIVTFYETATVPGLSELVVNKHSAIMEIPGEDIVPMFADHREICRFEGVKDNGYNHALHAIKRLARNALSKQGMASKSDRRSSTQSFNEAEKACMVLLNSIHLAEYKAHLPKPVQGTCSWILSHPVYMDWIAADETRLLWITGEPGCGKTMVSAYLTDHLKLARNASVQAQVFFFFCDDKVKSQRDANAILRGILYQMVQQRRKLIKHVKSQFELDGPSLSNSFPALWELFLKMVASLPPGMVGVIVDAIDECEVRTRKSFLNAVTQLVNETTNVHHPSRHYIKFLVTSRPSLGNSYSLTKPVESRLSIEQNQGNVSDDVKLVIQHKVGAIANRLRCDDETKVYLQQLLYSKSNQSFLWLDMVLQSLDQSPRASKREFERIIGTFPQNLEATYSRFLCCISPDDQNDARKILRLLIGASRHLTLEEVNMAFTIEQEHRSVTDMVDELQLSIRSTLQNIVGSFIRIQQGDRSSDEDSKVSLIHQSAKEFLTELAFHSTDNKVQSLAIPLADAALGISQSCIRYLLLDDFQSNLLAAQGTSLETSSPISYDSLPLNEINSMDSESPLGLDDHLGLDNFFKNSLDMDEEQCALITQRYPFFDYCATYWAEHYSSCEAIAPKSVQDAVDRLTAGSSCILTNWLKYYWYKSNMEYSFPDVFETVEVAAFFNFSILLSRTLQEGDPASESRKVQALFWAARMSSLDCMRVLLQHEVNPNITGTDRQTPLTIAAQYGHLDAVNILLNHPQTEITLSGKSGRSALSFAAGNGHLEIVEALLKHGAFRPDDQDNTHWTPLFWAVQGDYASIVQLFMKQATLDINKVDKSGRSVLSWAAGEGVRRTLKLLLRHSSVDINLKDSKGRSPLSWAAGNGEREVVHTLLHKSGIDKTTKDNDLRNAISWACQGGHIDTMRILSKNMCGGEDDVDIDSWTPLLWALFLRSPATVEALLSTGKVQINRQDGYGRTALIWAASYGYLDVVQLLVAWKADVHIKNQKGYTAADVARIEGHFDIYEFLEGQ